MITKRDYTLFILGIFISGILAGLFIIGAINGNHILRIIGTLGVFLLVLTNLTVGKKVKTLIKGYKSEDSNF